MLYCVKVWTMVSSGVIVKLFVVAGVVIVTTNPLVMESTIPTGPQVLMEKVVVGQMEGGLQIPLKVIDILELVISAEKQLLRLTVLPLIATVHEVAIKLAEEIATVPKVMVEGKSIEMSPFAGMGSGNTAAIVQVVSAQVTKEAGVIEATVMGLDVDVIVIPETALSTILSNPASQYVLITKELVVCACLGFLTLGNVTTIEEFIDMAPEIDRTAQEVLVTEQLIKALLVVHPPTVAVNSAGNKI